MTMIIPITILPRNTVTSMEDSGNCIPKETIVWRCAIPVDGHKGVALGDLPVPAYRYKQTDENLVQI